MRYIHFRVPNPESVLVIHTPMGVFSPKDSLQNHNGCFRGSKLVSSKNVELLESSTSKSNEFEPLSAARCRIYRRSPKKVVIWYFCTHNLFCSRILHSCLFSCIYSHNHLWDKAWYVDVGYSQTHDIYARDFLILC